MFFHLSACGAIVLHPPSVSLLALPTRRTYCRNLTPVFYRLAGPHIFASCTRLKLKYKPPTTHLEFQHKAKIFLNILELFLVLAFSSRNTNFVWRQKCGIKAAANIYFHYSSTRQLFSFYFAYKLKQFSLFDSFYLKYSSDPKDFEYSLSGGMNNDISELTSE